MKMKDVFKLPLLTDNRDLVDVNNHIYADFDIDFSDGETHALAGALAINNHDKLTEMLTDVTNDLCAMIDTENARLKSRIKSTDLDEPCYLDHKTVHDAFKLLNEINNRG